MSATNLNKKINATHLTQKPKNERAPDGTWKGDYHRAFVEEIPEFVGFNFIDDLMEETQRTPYYAKPHPFLSSLYREETRRYIQRSDRALIATALLTAGRISEVLALHVENFSREGDFLIVKDMPLLKRLKRTEAEVEVLEEAPRGKLAKGFRYSTKYQAFVKTKWDTESIIKTREQFPIGVWEPYAKILIEWILETNKREPGPGGYKWLFPTRGATRQESPGVQKWIMEKFGLDYRPWMSGERGWQKLRYLGERLNKFLWPHWCRSQRASWLNKFYRYNEPLLNRYIGWAGGWVSTRQSMAARYTRTGLEDLEERMILGKDALLEELKTD